MPDTCSHIVEAQSPTALRRISDCSLLQLITRECVCYLSQATLRRWLKQVVAHVVLVVVVVLPRLRRSSRCGSFLRLKRRVRGGFSSVPARATFITALHCPVAGDDESDAGDSWICISLCAPFQHLSFFLQGGDEGVAKAATPNIPGACVRAHHCLCLVHKSLDKRAPVKVAIASSSPTFQVRRRCTR